MIWVKRVCVLLATLLIGIASMCVSAVLVASMALTGGDANSYNNAEPVEVAIMDRYDMYINHQTGNALEGVLEVDKVYWLSDDDQVAPEPDQSKFGITDDPATLGWLLEDAAKILEGQELLFSTDLEIMPRSQVRYYLDETILAITWKQVVGNTVYTVSEVKIAHPSQFRRFLAGGEYGSPIQLTTSEMAASVNAVVASSGDFYGFRRYGIIVYDGIVRRCDPEMVDTCYIDDQGNMLFSYRGELSNAESAQAFVDENNVRFSLAFGPVLVADGQPQQISGNYCLGEIHGIYARSGLGQLGDLHYIMVAANGEYPYDVAVNIFDFQKQMMAFGCQQAYTLDGGQTAVIVHNNEVINRVVYGYQRNVSDIIYFATAMPDWD